jgi:general secretion pathway protein I
LFRSTAHEDATAGFTLIEALVALSIVAIAMASLGSLIASTARGVRSIDGHLTRLETARAVMTALPDRDQLAPGALSGSIAGHPWRIEVSPFGTPISDQKSPAQWVPQIVVMTVQSSNGAAMQISTVRLQQRDGQ